MVLTKQYLRFAPEGIFGVVASKSCNAVYMHKKPLRFVITGGTNIINIWDTRFQRKVKTLNCDSPAVVIEPNHLGNKLAVGHQNGAVSIYDLNDLSEDSSPEPSVTFEGHTSEITCIAWDMNGTRIATGSKDTKVVVWDVLTETGMFKLIGHKGMISRVRFWKNDDYIITSSFDTTIRIWDVETKLNVHTIACTIQVRDFELKDDIIIVAEANLKLFNVTLNLKGEWFSDELGTLLRHAHDRPSRLHFVKDTGILLVVGVKSPSIEVFRLSSSEEAIKKMNKRLKKKPEDDNYIILRDVVRRGNSVKASEEKIKSISALSEKGVVQVMCCLPSNQLELIHFSEKEETGIKPGSEITKSDLLSFDGHKKLVRGIAFSSDKTAILTASGDCFKVWNRSTLSCILNIPHEYPVVCCSFCPGDRHFVAGTMEGMLIMADVSVGEITQVESGGSENVWGIDIYPDNMGFVSCNGNLIQLYDFSMADGKLRFDLKKQLDVQESILCVKISPNMKFVAAGLLDSTIKVFYLDTLKFHLSMYGHTLPVVSLDISSDSLLLVSCAGDKMVKVWGLDFGDCHCSMIHSDGLVGCSFLDKTHHVASMSKDSLNIYDADIHERIQTIKAHAGGGATCMTSKSFFVASAGRDQTLRLFKRTNEILVLEDEREHERELELEKIKSDDPLLTTVETSEGEVWTDKVIEALDIYKDPNSIENPLIAVFKSKDQRDFLFKTLTTIKAAELQRSLMLLPVAYVNELVPALNDILQTYPLSFELVVRCLCSLMKFHMITVRGISKTVLKSISELTSNRLQNLTRLTAINKVGLENLYEMERKKEQEQVFREMVGERKRKRKKREKAAKRAILMV